MDLYKEWTWIKSKLKEKGCIQVLKFEFLKPKTEVFSLDIQPKSLVYHQIFEKSEQILIKRIKDIETEIKKPKKIPVLKFEEPPISWRERYGWNK